MAEGEKNLGYCRVSLNQLDGDDYPMRPGDQLKQNMINTLNGHFLSVCKHITVCTFLPGIGTTVDGGGSAV